MKTSKIHTDYGKLNGGQLEELMSYQFHAGMIETFETALLQLETAHKLDRENEEIEFSIGVIKAMEKNFSGHIQKEEQMLFPLLAPSKKKTPVGRREAEDVKKLIEELKGEHSWLRNQLSLLHQATHNYSCGIDTPPSQKLAYAHLNDLEQDFKRMFFVEEEYVFPRILRLNHK